MYAKGYRLSKFNQCKKHYKRDWTYWMLRTQTSPELMDPKTLRKLVEEHNDNQPMSEKDYASFERRVYRWKSKLIKKSKNNKNERATPSKRVATPQKNNNQVNNSLPSAKGMVSRSGRKVQPSPKIGGKS